MTASTLQLGLAFAGVLAGLGLTFLLLGGGLVWAGMGRNEIVALSIDDRILEQNLV